ncbi:hypothetical protein Sango_1375700 [Sesamum angolense]|uniref:Uncharacterized protein n=1 Tax=Sesamum angolense TaxID=2727404 RepID=A0AAE2BV55_9LAMI|nr:hypothetical protein Sango_1375700 [Sesamum angolense]
MSKKKATMTLKDFHGGSIPSDLPLPSAPGVTVRPVDRGGFDRQGSWGNSMGRSDHRLRPASAGSSRNLDEKTPFLSHSSHIGRNFDEDERKPLDGASGPRRTVGDDSFRAQTSRVGEPKTDNLPGARVGNRAASSPAYQISSGLPGSSYAGRVGEVHNARLNSQTFSGSRSYGSNYPISAGNAGQAVSGSYPNAWGLGKETTIKKEPAPAAWSAPDAASKLAHASALEKVSSGRWSSKQHGHPVKDAEVLGHTESEAEFEHNANNIYSKKTYNRLDVAGDSKNYDIALVMHTERSLAIDDGIHGGGKEMPTYDRARSTIRVESYERNTSVAANGFQSLHPSGKSGGTQLQSTLPSESSERPKLKLLPRSKPLENLELPVDYKQGYEQTSSRPQMEDIVVYGPKSPIQSSVAGSPVGDRTPERPKLNLKPRSQPLEQHEGNGEAKSKGMTLRLMNCMLLNVLRCTFDAGCLVIPFSGSLKMVVIWKRGTVFGGARPREVMVLYDSSPIRFTASCPALAINCSAVDGLGSVPSSNQLVLKERGVEDDVSNYESQPPVRVKEASPKADTFLHVTPASYSEKAEGIPTDQRIGKYPDRRDHQLNGERTDSQRRSRQNEIRRNSKDVEKHRNQQQKQPQERPLSPETWRKPVEHAKPATPDAPPLRYGKAASAVELAQAFSKSVSDPTVADRLPGPRGIPSRNQMPFSRLMGPTPRPQINGY